MPSCQKIKIVRLILVFLLMLFSGQLSAKKLTNREERSVKIIEKELPDLTDSWDRLSSMMIFSLASDTLAAEEDFYYSDLFLWLGNLFAKDIEKNRQLFRNYGNSLRKTLPGYLSQKLERQKRCSMRCLLKQLKNIDPAGKLAKKMSPVVWGHKNGLIPTLLLSRDAALKISKGQAAEIIYSYFLKRYDSSSATTARTVARAAALRLKVISKFNLARQKKRSLAKPIFASYLLPAEKSDKLFDKKKFAANLKNLKKAGINTVFLWIPANLARNGSFYYGRYPFNLQMLKEISGILKKQQIQLVLAPRLYDSVKKVNVGLEARLSWTSKALLDIYRDFYLYYALVAREIGALGLSIGESFSADKLKSLCQQGFIKEIKKYFFAELIVSLPLSQLKLVGDSCLGRLNMLEIFEQGISKIDSKKLEDLSKKISKLHRQTLLPVSWRSGFKLLAGKEEKSVLDRELAKNLNNNSWFCGEILPACPYYAKLENDQLSCLAGLNFSIGCPPMK